jgi:hypothetical protein
MGFLLEGTQCADTLNVCSKTEVKNALGEPQDILGLVP